MAEYAGRANGATFDLTGPFGDSVFHRFEEWAVDSRELTVLQDTLSAMMAHLRSTGDERSLVLVGQLIVEHAVDDLLAAFIPRYRDTRDIRRMSFSTRLAFAKALQLCPRRLLDCAGTVNRIRNEFAHDLNVDSLGKMSQDTVIELSKVYRDSYARVLDGATDRVVIFIRLVEDLAIALHIYRMQISCLNSLLRSDSDLVPILKQHSAQRGIGL